MYVKRTVNGDTVLIYQISSVHLAADKLEVTNKA